MLKFQLLTLFLLGLVVFFVEARSIESKKTLISEDGFPEILSDNEPNTAFFDRILSANERENDMNQLYEGDIQLDVFRNAHGRKWLQSRSGLVKIPYVIDQKFTVQNRTLIQNALEAFHKHTCIRFVPRRFDPQYLSLESRSSCWSYIGRTTRRKQTVAFSVPKCFSKGSISHELMHAIGFRHEHSRSDRDQYIQIIEENINPGIASGRYRDVQLETSTCPNCSGFTETNIRNFRKVPNTKNLVIYDYTSIMHYPLDAFSKQPYLPSIKTLAGQDNEPSIGFRERLSAYDIEEIKYHYGCGSRTYNRCGRDFYNQRRGTFQSPNYPTSYPAESHCTWNITVGQGKRVRIMFTGIQLEDSSYCQLDSIIVHDGNNAAAPVLMKICGRKAQLDVTSSGNQMFIIFTTDTSLEFGGFRASFAEVVPNSHEETHLTPASTNFIDEFRCNFDKDMCGMMHDAKSDIKFRLQHGSTPSNDTGPSSDHTSGEGKYIYLESSNSGYGGVGIIRSPWITTPGRMCLKFSYHMFGNSMGGLRVYAYEKKINEEHATKRFLWEIFGNQGDQWQTTSHLYSPQGKLEFVQFYWEGYVPHYTSDIAIDDVQITPGYCSRHNRYNRRFRPFFFKLG